jgi:hypothetical protein
MTNETRDFEALSRRLDELEIEVSRTPEGCLTICSAKEPVFCFDVNTHEEAESLVADTIRSYAKHFFNVDIDVTAKDVPLPAGRLEVESGGTPVGRITPVFALAA